MGHTSRTFSDQKGYVVNGFVSVLYVCVNLAHTAPGDYCRCYKLVPDHVTIKSTVLEILLVGLVGG